MGDNLVTWSLEPSAGWQMSLEHRQVGMNDSNGVVVKCWWWLLWLVLLLWFSLRLLMFLLLLLLLTPWYEIQMLESFLSLRKIVSTGN